MSKDKIEKMLELIEELVNEEGSVWSAKRQQVVEQLNERTETALNEFCSWWDA